MPTLRRADITGLGLSDRVWVLRDALLENLPGTYAELETVFRSALRDERFAGWMIWPVTEAVAARALGSPLPSDFGAGLVLLADLTNRLTSEFAIRSFLRVDLLRSLAVVLTWTNHPEEDVRRLASEGTRARLPWAKRVPALFADPSPTVPILDALYRDGSDYVRRSVANHLNDISRLDPALAVRTAQRWLADPSPTTARLVRHAMRTLTKQGYPEALALLGFLPVPGQRGDRLRGAFREGQRSHRRKSVQADHQGAARWAGSDRDQEALLPSDQHEGLLPGHPSDRRADQRGGARIGDVRPQLSTQSPQKGALPGGAMR